MKAREASDITHAGAGQKSGLGRISLTALGVVFGDIGTSPLYAVRECFHGEYGIAATQANVLGVISLMTWALIMIVTLKYVVFVLRADNQGEGGVMALTALIKQKQTRGNTHRRSLLVTTGLFGACLIYGDGMITPAISVLSAVEGIRVVTPTFVPYIIPLTIGILAGLFLLQRRGTTWVGSLFGPVMLVWFCMLAILGAVQLIRAPQILAALSPWHGVVFLVNNNTHGILVLGAIFLVVTGAEALYADMGHFGKGPIRLTWIGFVLPALVLNYFGQGSLLLIHPEMTDHPFYALAPTQLLVPLVILSATATIIASQALITGAFSMTRQAIQLGYLPRMHVTHTSARQEGQIYVAPVNWLLMICTISLVIGFQSSSKIAAAYGVAVSATMLITTLLFYRVARLHWGWSRLAAAVPVGFFLLADITFFVANLSKLLHGAWFPLVVSLGLLAIMLTWEQGRKVLPGQLLNLTTSFEQFNKELENHTIKKVKGRAVFLTGNPGVVPVALIQNLKHNKVLHSDIAVLYFKIENIPRVPNARKVQIEKLGAGIYGVTARRGFMEEPKINAILALIREQGLDFDIDNASFFLGREKLVIGSKANLAPWRAYLFAFLSRNAMDAAAFYGIPPRRVIEVGVQLEL
jgi:KUP system potassium uptake protein